jgi:hypothetical protein
MLKNGNNSRISFTDVGIFLLISVCWALSSMYQLVKYFHVYAIFAVLAGMLGIAAILTCLRWLQHPGKAQIHWAWLVAFWIVMTALYVAIYPIAQRHTVGLGNDEEDTLRLTAYRLLQRQYPYTGHTYLGNPITPFTGTILLATPFVLLGRASIQNLVWLALFILFCVKFFRFRSTALAFLLVMVLNAADVLNDFVVGADYTINTMYICVAVFLFLRTFDDDEMGWRHLLAGALLGLSLSSRVVYVVIPPLVLAYLLQRGKGAAAALRSVALPILLAIAITVPFYLYDPAHFSPLEVGAKLKFMPPEYAQLMKILLPALALSIACMGFFLRLSMRRLYLLAGLAAAMIVLPSGLIAFGMHQNGYGIESVDYSKSAMIFIALWAFAKFESKAESPLAISG